MSIDKASRAVHTAAMKLVVLCPLAVFAACSFTANSGPSDSRDDASADAAPVDGTSDAQADANSDAATDAERVNAFDVIGDSLTAARQQHDGAKALDETLFGEDFDTA